MITIDSAMSLRYPVIFEQAEHNWAAYVPDLPGCISTGKTLEETERIFKKRCEAILRCCGNLASGPEDSILDAPLD